MSKKLMHRDFGMPRQMTTKPITITGLALASLFAASLGATELAIAQGKTKADTATATGTAGTTPTAMPMGAPNPPPELEATYKMLDGSWTCETTFLANAMGPGSPEIKTKTAIKIKKDLNGFWYRGDYEAKKTKDFHGMKGTIYLGHDGKQLLIGSVDAMGGLSAGTGSASGDTLTFTTDGYLMGMKLKMRETIEKKSAKEIAHHFEADMGKGFQSMGHDVCKK